MKWIENQYHQNNIDTFIESMTRYNDRCIPIVEEAERTGKYKSISSGFPYSLIRLKNSGDNSLKWFVISPMYLGSGGNGYVKVIYPVSFERMATNAALPESYRVLKFSPDAIPLALKVSLINGRMSIIKIEDEAKVKLSKLKVKPIEINPEYAGRTKPTLPKIQECWETFSGQPVYSHYRTHQQTRLSKQYYTTQIFPGEKLYTILFLGVYHPKGC